MDDYSEGDVVLYLDVREVARTLAGCLHALEEDTVAWCRSGICD
jgi:hypothetical protein